MFGIRSERPSWHVWWNYTTRKGGNTKTKEQKGPVIAIKKQYLHEATETYFVVDDVYKSWCELCGKEIFGQFVSDDDGFSRFIGWYHDSLNSNQQKVGSWHCKEREKMEKENE